MQRLEVSGAVRLIYRSLGVKGLKEIFIAICWVFNIMCQILREFLSLYAFPLFFRCRVRFPLFNKIKNASTWPCCLGTCLYLSALSSLGKIWPIFDEAPHERNVIVANHVIFGVEMDCSMPARYVWNGLFPNNVGLVMSVTYLVRVIPVHGSGFLYQFLVCRTYMTSVTLN
jgi:hypothetical protein